MDTIINYLDNMFIHFPDTPDVIRAKEDLAEMMEDKYNELIAEGKMENEAIGIVISEFGNIQELADELGIERYQSKPEAATQAGGNSIDLDETKSETSSIRIDLDETKSENKSNAWQKVKSGIFDKDIDKDKEFLQLSNAEAEEYLLTARQSAAKIAIGVLFCICCPILIILLAGIQANIMPIPDEMIAGIGVSVLLIMVACAVGLFISAGMKLDKYDYLKKECFIMDEEFEEAIYQMRDSRKGIFVFKIIAGVMMCILSCCPLIVASGILGSSGHDFLTYVAVAILLFVVGIAVALFITAGMEDEAYQIILQEKEFTINKKSRKKIWDIIGAVYWPVVVAVYLAWSFISGKWGTTWIIWPLAGVLFKAISEFS